LVLLRLDTPGGLDTAMREIVQAVLASPLPVVAFVAPAGARAASAGSYILLASHVAAMAPGTTLGAATPVALGAPGRPPGGDDRDRAAPDPARPPDAADKAVNDAAAYIRGLAGMRGRNAEWAERAVREAASLPAADALQAGVIDLVADDVPALLGRLDGRTVAMPAGPVVLKTAGRPVEAREPDWRTTLLAVITSPAVAAILMMIGIYGIIFEFYAPGYYAPGVIGAICLILALYAFHLLPIDYAGLGLVLLGILLLAGEAFVPSFGALGMGGLIAFVVGAVMLVDGDIPGMHVAWPVVGGAALTIGAVMTGVLTLVARARQRPVTTGADEIIGADGLIADWQGDGGRVRVHGVLWQARRAASAAAPPGIDVGIGIGARVRVVGVDGLTLVVEPRPDGGGRPA
jgi:membrane-bound serine protease (ClpP class)